MNCVRKALSAIKGGRLARAAFPAKVVTYLISDVPGDDPAAIASGPTVASTATVADAIEILSQYNIDVTKSIQETLKRTIVEQIPMSGCVNPDGEIIMLATAQDALESAAREATLLGFRPIILSDCMEGEAREVGLVHAGIANQIKKWGQPIQFPAAVISGGETTVTIRGDGRGGPNAEFLLSLAIALNGAPGIHALAADTDGIYGSEDNAGALIGPDSLKHMQAAGLDPVTILGRNDAYSAFANIDDLLMTGPTFTNVNDLRVILVEE